MDTKIGLWRTGTRLYLRRERTRRQTHKNTHEHSDSVSLLSDLTLWPCQQCWSSGASGSSGASPNKVIVPLSKSPTLECKQKEDLTTRRPQRNEPQGKTGWTNWEDEHTGLHTCESADAKFLTLRDAEISSSSILSISHAGCFQSDRARGEWPTSRQVNARWWTRSLTQFHQRCSEWSQQHWRVKPHPYQRTSLLCTPRGLCLSLAPVPVWLADPVALRCLCAHYQMDASNIYIDLKDQTQICHFNACTAAYTTNPRVLC